jgi:hypothetical protein
MPLKVHINMEMQNLEVLVEHFYKLAKKKPKWKKLPKGWSQKTVKKYWDSLTEESEHPFTECVKEMKGKMKKPEGFCAKTKDVATGTTKWRGEGRKKKKKKKN